MLFSFLNKIKKLRISFYFFSAEDLIQKNLFTMLCNLKEIIKPINIPEIEKIAFEFFSSKLKEITLNLESALKEEEETKYQNSQLTSNDEKSLSGEILTLNFNLSVNENINNNLLNLKLKNGRVNFKFKILFFF